ncbi:MAG: hypothetical protein Q7J38_13040 [Gallionella sp.]|nr:hypothetical protein [Gallionella sp.]
MHTTTKSHAPSLLIVAGMTIQHDYGHREKPVQLAGDARQPRARPIARLEINRQKNEAFYLVGLHAGIAEKTHLPGGKRGKFVVGKLEQEGHARPVCQAGRFCIEMLDATQQGFNLARKSLRLCGPIQRFVAGVAEGREQLKGACAQVAGGR